MPQIVKGGITVAPRVLEEYSIGIGNRLPVMRGSGLAIGFVARGPLVEAAERHPKLEVF